MTLVPMTDPGLGIRKATSGPPNGQDGVVFTEIRATNFKSWQRVAPSPDANVGDPDDPPTHDESRPGLPLAPVTGLFGTNSSGKTSLLQILLLLKQTVESADRTQPLDVGDDRSLVRLGTFADVLHGHDETERLSLGLSWRTPEEVEIADPTTEDEVLFSARTFAFDTTLVQRKGTIEVDHFRYCAEQNIVNVTRLPGSKSEYRLDAVVNGDSTYLKRMLGRKWPLPNPIKCYGFPDQVNAYFQNAGFVSDLELAFEEQIGRTYYLGPLREVPKRDYTWTGARPRDVGVSGAGAVPALLATRIGDQKSNYRKRYSTGKRSKLISVEQHVAEWLLELGLVHSFRVAPLREDANIYRVHVKRSATSAEVLLTDIGFGVSQVLPVLVLLAYVREGSTVVLEQPEIHLHPAVQAGLADVILEAAIVRKVQVIVESHSEHLLRRIQLRVAEGKMDNGTTVSSDEVRLWFVDQAGSESRAADLRLNIFGEIENWPQNFFGDPFGETARIAKASLKHRQQLSTTVDGEH